jgi:hypothetical protein
MPANGNVAAQPISLSYQVVNYSNGDKLTFCDVFTSATSFSGQLYNANGTVGAQQGSCIVEWDPYNDGRGGFFTFRNDTSGERGIFTDTGTTVDQTTFVFAAGACH